MAALAASAGVLCPTVAAAAAAPRATAFAGRALRRSSAPQAARLSLRRQAGAARAALDEESPASKVVEDLKAKWDAIDDKSTVVVYAGGALVTLWLSSTVVSAVNSVPLLPKLLELVGTLYTAWFVYRYLLFKSSRAELGELVEDLKSKVAGK